MILGLTTIQKNRGPWLTEWFAFHHMMGVSKFYFYAHMCTDNTHEVLQKLSLKLDIEAVVIPGKMDRVQLAAYQHACDNHLSKVDWMVFMDGDEFMFSPEYPTLTRALADFDDEPISAVAAYNVTFGSNGHVEEPAGNIIENYRTCAYDPITCMPNKNVKSFVKGRQKITTTTCSHIFNTPLGTFDEQLRPVSWGMSEHTPSYEKLRYNHYVTQSYEYFKMHKKHSGHADAGSDNIREDKWFLGFDRNDEYDKSLVLHFDKLREVKEWLSI